MQYLVKFAVWFGVHSTEFFTAFLPKRGCLSVLREVARLTMQLIFFVSVFMSLSQLTAAVFLSAVSLVISKDFCYLTDSTFLLHRASYRVVYHGKGTPGHLLGGML